MKSDSAGFHDAQDSARAGIGFKIIKAERRQTIDRKAGKSAPHQQERPSLLPSDLETVSDILTPEHGNTDYRSKSHYPDSGVGLRKPCQNHLAGPYFLDLIVIHLEYLHAFLVNAIEDI